MVGGQDFEETMDNILIVFLVSKGKIMFPLQMLSPHQELDNDMWVYSNK